MPDLTPPDAGRRHILRPYTDGHYTTHSLPLEDPLAGATEAQRAYYIAHYDGIPLAEILFRLRAAEWDAAAYKEQLDAAKEQLAALPPLYRIQDIAARHKRITALLAGGGRISRALLTAALAEGDDTWNARYPDGAMTSPNTPPRSHT